MTSSPTTRASLLLRLRDSQDHAAWVEFVALYEPVTYRILRRHGLQDADARETMQELFLAVSRNIDRWEPARERGSFRGWLRRVCRNLVINWLKQPGRRNVLIGGPELQAFLETLPADEGPESVEFDRELRRGIFHRAAELVRSEVRPATWQAFVETCLSGTTAVAAASKLGVSPGSVRMAKCRVLSRIQEIVREWERQT